jgi:hypothetical protein
MDTNNKRLTYGICILAVTALLLTVISHSGRKVERPKEAPIPWKGEAPSQAVVSPVSQGSPAVVSSSSNGSNEGHPSTQPDPRPAPQPSQPSHPSDEASSAGSSLPPSFTAPSYQEESSAPDSDQSPAQPQETASQRVGRQLRRH